MSVIKRHKTALKRNNLSLPIRTALSKGLLTKKLSVFDYGCGQGDDIRHLTSIGYQCAGWDPYFSPKKPSSGNFDFVNLGFVLNTIEDRDERSKTLVNADAYAKKVLLVSCMLTTSNSDKLVRPYKDGFLTSSGTFQKYYGQSELKNYVEGVVNELSYAVGPGIFAVIKDPELLEEFEYIRCQTPANTTLKQIHYLKTNPNKFEKTQAQLVSEYVSHKNIIHEFIKRHARAPDISEFAILAEKTINQKLFKFTVERIQETIEPSEFERLALNVKQQLLINFCMRKFYSMRTTFPLSYSLKKDIRFLFQSQKNLRQKADSLLLQLGQKDVMQTEIEAAIQKELGVSIDQKFIFHQSKLPYLSLRLKLLVSLANLLSGDDDECEIYQIHDINQKVTKLYFYDYATSAAPKLQRRVKVTFSDNNTIYTNYSEKKDIRIMLLKTPFMQRHDPNFEKQKQFENAIISSTNMLENWRSWSVSELYGELSKNHIEIPRYH